MAGAEIGDTVPNGNHQDILQIMEHGHGLDVSRYHESFLGQTLERRRQATGSQDAQAYARHLAGSREEAQALGRALQNTYSEFFRDPLTFAILEQLVLPGLAQAATLAGGAELRVWSAGCAAGQEAYSVAIMLEDISAARESGLSYRVFATDIDEVQLAAGRRGLYERAALGGVRLRHLEAYFAPQGQAHQILPRLRQRVDFSSHDLLDQRLASPPASIYGGFYLILCGNLLFYYRPALQRAMLDKLTRCLAPGGYLATGRTERLLVEQWGGLTAVAAPAPVFRMGQTIQKDTACD